MFSFVDDTVLDPFLGTGTTSLAAAQCARNSVGIEVDPAYFDHACERLKAKTSGLFSSAALHFHQ
jgi:DNA modification methylase